MRKILIFLFLISLLIPLFANATDYYVTKTGSDAANLCTLASPCLTLDKGVSKLSGGDTLFVDEGSYNQTLITSSTSTMQIPSGTSWATATRITALPISTPGGCDPRGSDGTVVRPACQGTTYKRVVLTTSSLSQRRINISKANVQYVIFEGFVIIASGFPVSINQDGSICTNVGSPHHLRLMNMEVTGGGSSGIFISMISNNNEMLNVWSHHNGSDNKDHGIYLSGMNNLIDGGIYENNSGVGVHGYRGDVTCVPPMTGMRVQNTIMRNNGSSGGLMIGGVVQGLFKNNLVYGNGTSGLQIGGGGSASHKVYNNTIWANAGTGITILETADDSIIKNNITDGINNIGALGIILSNNLTSSTADHKFVDPVNGDFRLQEGSDAVDTGTNLTSEGVTVDLLGVSRPQGTAFDIGAYELTESGGEPVPPFDYGLANEGNKSVNQGSDVDNVITVTKSSGTAAEVTFSATGLPTGATIDFVPTSCTPTTPCTTTATISAHATTPEGVFPITIIGTSGGLSRTTTFNLEVICQ